MTIDATPREHSAPPAARSRAALWIVLVAILALAIGGFFLVRARRAAAPAGPAGAAGGERVVPVTVAPVAQKDVPIWLEGLGNVLPLATVQVRTQVDGRLDAVFFKEGQSVKKGELLAQIDPRPFTIQLHNAEAALARDSATVRNAQLDLARYKTLREQNLIPQQQVDTQQTTADQAAATVKSDEAQIEAAKLNLTWARITSPIDGVVGVRQVDPGNLVHVADSGGIVTVTQLDPIAVLFTLPQDDLARVAAQQAKGPIPVDALSREGTQKLASGELTVIDNLVNPTTATIRLKAQFPNPARVLWPNAFVKARLLLEMRKDAVVVPAPVVQRGPQGSFAYVVQPDNTVKMQPVEVDLTQGDLAIIAKGLTPGQLVVTDGQNQLRPGAKIAPQKSGAGGAPPAGEAAPPPNEVPPGAGQNVGQGQGGGRHRGGP